MKSSSHKVSGGLCHLFMSAGRLLDWELESEVPSQSVPKVDNTTRENKCGAVLGYLSYLVASCGFRLAGMLNSRVGHTHNRLGTFAEIIL